MGFEPTMPLFERAKTFHALDRAATVTGITPFSPLNFNRLLGRTYRLHLQDRRISQVRKQREAGRNFLIGLFFDPEDGGDMFARNAS
jgi:hypothetical protein